LAWKLLNLPFECHCDRLESLFVEVLWQVAEGVEVLHGSGFRLDVLSPAIGICGFEVAICQNGCDSLSPAREEKTSSRVNDDIVLDGS